jgi:hypothetical protein
MPHLLVTGQTAPGKCRSPRSCSILLTATPDVRLLIGDAKRVDFTAFGDLAPPPGVSRLGRS